MPIIKKQRLDEQGFASIVIALVLIIVLGLLTVGFAQLARREQQNSLDKQLATQAYYAAESGINDTVKAMPAIAASSTVNSSTCLSSTLLPNSNVSSTNGVSYSCVLVDLKPPDLVYTNVGPGSERNATFSTTGTLSSLTVSWSSTDGKTALRPDNAFTPLSGWNSPAVIGFSITPLAATDRTSLINNTFTAYLYPATGGGSIAYNTGNQGQIVNGACTATGCSVNITGLPGAANESYLVHLLDYYDTSDITVSNAQASGGGGQLYFVDGQAQIDATGKAHDVLKRIQVRVPISVTGTVGASSDTLSPFAIEGQNVCKRFSTYPGSTTAESQPGCDLN